MEAGAPGSFAVDPLHRTAAGARVPLAFMAFGVASLAHALACLAIEPSLLLQPHLSPRVLSLVHAWVPGFLLSVCLGACYQMMPVVLGVPLAGGSRRTWIHFGLHAVGATVIISGFLRGRYELVAAGGVSVVTGIVIFSRSAWLTFMRSQRRDAIAWSFPVAATWLLATVLLGLAVAIDRRWGLLGLPTVRLLGVHAHLGLAGFFLTLLQGVAFQLVPMFTMGEVRRARLVGLGLAATQTGLLLLASGLAMGGHWFALAGACVITCGVGASGIALESTLRARRRRSLEWPVRAFVAGAAIVPLAAAGGVLMTMAGGSVPPSWTAAYGAAAIAGALSLMILGMLLKIVPFLVWLTVYGPKVGKARVPTAASLASIDLSRAWLLVHMAGMAFTIIAMFRGSEALAIVAASVLSAAGVLYIWNFGRVVRHLVARWRPDTGVPKSEP